MRYSCNRIYSFIIFTFAVISPLSADFQFQKLHLGGEALRGSCSFEEKERQGGYKSLEQEEEKEGIEYFSKLKISYETSLGYAGTDSRIISVYGKSLGSFKEHFGTMPVFGFSLKYCFDKAGFKLGYFFQRSKPSFFQIDLTYPKWYINFTLEQFYIQVYYNIDLCKRLTVTPLIGLATSKLDIDRIEVDPGTDSVGLSDGFSLSEYLDYKGPILSFQISYKLNSIHSIFLMYNFMKKDNVSCGLSF